MPLEFLRRKGTGTPARKGVAPLPVAPQPVPEEALAEDHQLRLSFAAKDETLQRGIEILNRLAR